MDSLGTVAFRVYSVPAGPAMPDAPVHSYSQIP
jgi:hypothetical protein